jgi:threonyl-tRNA synthetase
VGEAAQWEKAEAACRAAAEGLGVPFSMEPGEAAFYGPKIDFVVRDVIGREWQLGTVQVDYQLPQRFELEYVGADNKPHRPVMIHRAPFGSLERFIGVLIEHCGGNFLSWLAPVQVAVLPVGQDFENYAEEVGAKLRAAGFRVEVDTRNEKVGYKIRGAEMQKTPYMLIVGEREQEAGTVAVRRHGEGNQGAVPLGDFISQVQDEIAEQLGRTAHA